MRIIKAVRHLRRVEYQKRPIVIRGIDHLIQLHLDSPVVACRKNGIVAAALKRKITVFRSGYRTHYIPAVVGNYLSHRMLSALVDRGARHRGCEHIVGRKLHLVNIPTRENTLIAVGLRIEISRLIRYDILCRLGSCAERIPLAAKLGNCIIVAVDTFRYQCALIEKNDDIARQRHCRIEIAAADLSEHAVINAVYLRVDGSGVRHDRRIHAAALEHRYSRIYIYQFCSYGAVRVDRRHMIPGAHLISVVKGIIDRSLRIGV